MPPRDIKSLLEFIKNKGDIDRLAANLIAQWGPPGRAMLSPLFLPPRLVSKNQDTLDTVRFRTVAAKDGTRYSPAQLVGGGEMFGKINYRFGHSDIARQITGPDYDGILNLLGANLGMQAAGQVLGIYDTLILQAMVEHDELANWEAIVFNRITRRGDNGYFDYEDGPDLEGHRVEAGGDWSDPAYDPWKGDIIPRIRFMTRLGYSRAGLRTVMSDAVKQTLADNPFTLRRAFNSTIAFEGQTLDEAQPVVDVTDVDKVFRKLGVQAPITNDLIVQTETGEKRAYPEDHMTMIASTGRSEQVRYLRNGAEEIVTVNDTLGFSGIGIANGQLTPGRRTATRSYTDEKAARIELEGWQASGPVILDPTAITDIGGIELGDI